jgi:hypothetical protein
MNRLSLFIILSLTAFIVTKDIPSVIYQRDDDRWSSKEILPTNCTIIERPQNVDEFNGKGTKITLLSTALTQLKIKWDNKELDPGCLTDLYNYNLQNPGKVDVNDVLQIRDYLEVHAKDGINWYQIYWWVLLDSEVFFYTHAETDGTTPNIAGSIYEMHIDYRFIKYYDDLGNFGEVGFDQVEYISLTRFETHRTPSFLKLLK